MLKSKRFANKRHLNQLRPRHTKDVTQKIDEEMQMEVLYGILNILVPLTPLMPEVSVPLTPSMKEVSAP